MEFRFLSFSRQFSNAPKHQRDSKVVLLGVVGWRSKERKLFPRDLNFKSWILQETLRKKARAGKKILLWLITWWCWILYEMASWEWPFEYCYRIWDQVGSSLLPRCLQVWRISPESSFFWSLSAHSVSSSFLLVKCQRKMKFWWAGGPLKGRSFGTSQHFICYHSA